MFAKRRQLLLAALKLSDLGILLLSLVLADWIANHGSSSDYFRDLSRATFSARDLVLLLLLLPLWHYVLSFFALYESRRLDRPPEEAFHVWCGVTTASLFAAGIIFILRRPSAGLAFLALFWLVATVLTISFRTLLRQLLRRIRRSGRNLRNVIIVGTNAFAHKLREQIDSSPELGCRVLGFVDTSVFLDRGDTELLSTPDRFPSLLRERVIDEIMIALPIGGSYEMVHGLASKALEHGILVRYVYRLLEDNADGDAQTLFDSGAVCSAGALGYSAWQLAFKRILDFLASALALIVFSPALLAIALTVKLTSPGPAFFVQERLGYNKRRFKMYKFRSMVADAEQRQAQLEDLNEADGPVFKIKHDPRLTNVGAWLRRTSLDELPQLFNVLNGDMSLVGPRPLPVRDYEQFEKDWHCRRFSVLPGMTGLWQTNGRSGASFEEWLAMDLHYIDQWRLSLDLRILCRTIPAVIRRSGAW